MEQCKICGAELREVPGGVNREGKSYEAFMGCPDYKKHPPKGYPQTAEYPKPPQGNTGDMIVIEKLDALEKRLDNIEQGWGTKLIGIRKAFEQVQELINNKLKQ